MTRLLVFSNIPNPYNDALFEALGRDSRIDLTVLYAATSEGDRSWRLEPRDYRQQVLKGIGVRSTRWNPTITRRIRELDPDVALVSGTYTSPSFRVAVRALRRRGVPWCYWGERLKPGSTRLQRLVRAVLRRPLRRASLVLAVGEEAVRSYTGLGIPARRVVSFPYVADAAHFADERAKAGRADVRAVWGVTTEVVVVCAGQLIPRKAIDVLIRAVASPGASAFVTVVCGDGPERAALEALARKLDVHRSIRFAGFVQPAELPAMFAAADIFVLPSRYDGWGVVVAEAMAAGLPIVTTSSVGASELVSDQIGFVVAPEDVDALASSLSRLAVDQPLRLRFSSSASAAVDRDSTLRRASDLVRILESELLQPRLTEPER